MDRPEDVQPNPVNGRIYAALTNNSNRGSTFPVDEPNPVGSSKVRAALGAPLTTASGNRNGYVLEISENGSDHTGRAFTWVLLLVCGDPEAPETYFGGFPKDKVSPISCPDNVAFDAVGNLWVATDGNALGGQRRAVPGAGRRPGAREGASSSSPCRSGAECCGPLVGPDDSSVWAAIQHPGEGGTFDQPTSTWPGTHAFPRPGVVVTHRGLIPALSSRASCNALFTAA